MRGVIQEDGIHLWKAREFPLIFLQPVHEFPVWGKFKLPSAKAAPKFLLAEGEGKRFFLTTTLPEAVPAHSAEKAARRELP